MTLALVAVSGMAASAVWGAGLWVGLFAFLVWLSVLLTWCGLSVSVVFVALLVALAVPTAAWLAGAALDVVLADRLDVRTLRLLLLSISLVVFSDPLSFLEVVELALSENMFAGISLLMALLLVGKAVIATAAVSTFVIAGILWCWELPTAIWYRGRRPAFQEAFAGLRPLIIVLLLCSASELFMGFFRAELGPYSLLRHVSLLPEVLR